MSLLRELDRLARPRANRNLTRHSTSMPREEGEKEEEEGKNQRIYYSS